MPDITQTNKGGDIEWERTQEEREMAQGLTNIHMRGKAAEAVKEANAIRKNEREGS